MKKPVLFATALLAASASSFAQNANRAAFSQVPFENSQAYELLSAAKTTANGDTILKNHLPSTSTIAVYTVGGVPPADSGYVIGTNVYNDKAFAERYEFSKAGDSAVSVIGMRVFFTGAASATSSRTATLAVYSKGTKANYITGRSKLFLSGAPGTTMASRTINFKDLRRPSGRTDTLWTSFFTTPTAYMRDSFYVGVDFGNYNFANSNGDTVAILSITDGQRTTPIFYTSNGDTIVNAINSSQTSAGVWQDLFAQNRFNMETNLFIFPIVKVRTPSAVQGFSNRGLTVFGTFPNPAVNSTTLKFSIEKRNDVIVEVLDMTGRTLRSETLAGLLPGEHNVPVNTSDLAAGEYVVSLRTTSGGMAVQMTVAK